MVYQDGKIGSVDEKGLLRSIQRVSEEVSARASDEVKRRMTPQHRLTAEGRY